MNKYTLWKGIVLAAILFLTINTSAQDNKISFNLNGFADSYHAVRSQSPYDFMSSRSRLRTMFEVSKGKSYLFASLNAQHNALLSEQTGLEIREAFFQYTTNHWDLKAGRQIVIWGISDGMRVTDVISPMDMSEFLARDYDDIRMPVNAIKLKFYNSKLSLEGIFIPVASFSVIPTSAENPWSVKPPTGDFHYVYNLENYPDKVLKNCEYGGRLSFYLSGVDFSLSALHTWNKMPILTNSLSPNFDTVFLEGIYERMDMLGGNFSFPLGNFVIRGEVAEYFGELQKAGNTATKIKRNTSNLILGVDWYPGSEWILTTQYFHKYVPDVTKEMDIEQNTAIATFGVTKNTLRSTLKLSSFFYFDLSDEGIFNRSSVDYSLSDQIHLLLGYDWFRGDKGMFGYYKNNSEFWIKAKYSF